MLPFSWQRESSQILENGPFEFRVNPAPKLGALKLVSHGTGGRRERTGSRRGWEGHCVLHWGVHVALRFLTAQLCNGVMNDADDCTHGGGLRGLHTACA